MTLFIRAQIDNFQTPDVLDCGGIVHRPGTETNGAEYPVTADTPLAPTRVERTFNLAVARYDDVLRRLAD